MNWTTLRQLVPQAGRSPDFSACLAAFPQLELAKVTPQHPVYHAEGDVWTHTMMVIEALLAMPAYAQATRAQQEIVFLAALLHDVAKCSTTVIDPVTGAIGQPGHSRKGALDARLALWDYAVPFAAREAICRLIQVHQVPFFALETSRRGVTPEFTVRELSWQVDIGLLAMLAEADIRGRICPDPQRVLDAIELFRELAREEGCYDRPRAFVDDHTRVKYFRGAEAHPDYPLFQQPGSQVIVMSGLPASGKNTWVAKHHPQLPVVSFDDARQALGLRHGKNEGQVGDYAEERARELLRKGLPFVWNATHLSTLMREKTLNLLYKYHAQVELVYLEQTRKELLRRNGQRDTSLSNKKLQAMLWNWEIPLPQEAHLVRHEVE